MENEKKNNLKGLAGTLVFHGILLGLFLFFGFTTPLPLPTEQGIAINFGTSDEGMGDIQPENSGDNQAQNDAPATQQQNSSSSSGQQNVATQDVDEAPSVRANPNPKVTPRNTDPTPKPNETPVEDPKPTINNRALYPGAGSGARGGSQGQTGRPGDQGSRDGSRNTDRQGEGGRGGLDGDPTFSLIGRSIRYRPPIDNNFGQPGTVVIEITVNNRGEVIRAVQGKGTKGVTSSSQIQKCIEIALKTTFSPSSQTAEDQKGSMTFIFNVE